MSLDVVVGHPDFGVGEIAEIYLDTENPVVSVLLDDGKVKNYPADQLEFLPIER